MKLFLDVLAVFGAGCTLTGLWWIYPPLAMIAGGLVLVYVSWVFAAAGARRTRRSAR